MNDINTLVDFTVDFLHISARFVWYYDTPYRDDVEPNFIMDGVKIYYTDNFDNFNDNPMLSSFIVFSDDFCHFVLIITSGIDFVNFFDYMFGYLGYDDLVVINKL